MCIVQSISNCTSWKKHCFILNGINAYVWQIVASMSVLTFCLFNDSVLYCGTAFIVDFTRSRKHLEPTISIYVSKPIWVLCSVSILSQCFLQIFPLSFTYFIYYIIEQYLFSVNEFGIH